MLIAGGGPAGLTLAISLGQLGVSCEVVDARPAPARVPGAQRCGARAMEIFRRLGISGLLRDAALPDQAPLDVLICAGSLAAPLMRHRYPQVAEVFAAGLEVNDGTMPLEPHAILSQYTLEPLLREIAEATEGVTVSFGAELIDFTLVGGGVTAMVQTGSRLRTFRARYLAGCDGANSTVRSTLGIGLRGEIRQPLRQALIYSPDLYERLPAERAIQYDVVGEHPCTLIVQDDTQHFALHAPEGGPPMKALFEAVTWQQQPFGYKVLRESEWEQHLLIAEHYSDGPARGGPGAPGAPGARVFLVGDAAHPAALAGGLGLSVAVADAADLAWKLAGRLLGWGGPALLRSYEAERRPVAAQAITASLDVAEAERHWRAQWRADMLHDTPAGTNSRLRLTQAAAQQRWHADLPGVERGYRYTGSPVIAQAEGTPVAGAPDPAGYRCTPTTWPGTRLPHIWLDDGTPLHDMLGNGFTLLLLPVSSDVTALGYAREVAAAFGRLGAPLDVVEVTSETAQAVYAGHRLIMVRPDLHVAWRSGDSRLDAGDLAALVTGNLRTA